LIIENHEYLLEKAKSEELVYNWMEAAKCYKQVGDYYLSNNMTEEVALNHKKIGYTYSRAALTVDSSEDYLKRSKYAIDSYQRAINLYKQIGNKALQLECEALKYYVTSICQDSLTKSKNTASKAIELFVESSEHWSKMSNKESVARTLSQAAKTSVSLILFCEEQEEVLKLAIKARDLSENARRISEEIGNVQYLADALNAKVGIVSDMTTYNIEYQLLSILPKDHSKGFYLKTDRYLEYVDGSNDHKVLATIYNVVGRHYLDYGLFHIEEELEQQTILDKAISLLEKSVEFARKSNDKSVFIINLYEFFQAITVSGRIDYLVKKRAKYLMLLARLSRIFVGTYNFWNFFVNLALADYYCNTVMYSQGLMSVANKKLYAKSGIEYTKKALELTLFSPYRVHLYSVLTNFYSILTLLTASEKKQEDYSKIMLEFAFKAKEIGKEYKEGYPQPTRPQFTYHSALYIAYKTLADISESKEEKAKKLIKAAKALEKSDLGNVHLRLLIETKLNLGALYEKIGILTQDTDHLMKAKEILKDMIKESLRTGYTSARITGYSSLAGIEDRLGNYTSSAEYYAKVQSTYKELLKIRKTQKFRSKIREKIDYCGVWKVIETAKAYHKIDKHEKAKTSYMEASNILKDLPTLSYEAPYYRAWAFLEEAEQLGEDEKLEDSIKMYQTTQEAFLKASNVLKEVSKHIRDKDEKERIKKLGIAAQVRVDYCIAKSNLEEAKLLEKQGRYDLAAENFTLAATQFKELIDLFEIEQDRNDLEAIYYLCKAWRSMALAKEYRESIRYRKAANLFTKAYEFFTDIKLKLLAFGNSAICRALELGDKYDNTDEEQSKQSLYTEIKLALTEAASSHGKGGFKSGEYWALGTSQYFDAMWNLNKAQDQINITERKNLLEIGANYLKSAIKLFKKAGYEEKGQEIIGKLSNIEREEEILFSASTIIITPSITGSTVGIKAPACPVEISQSIKIEEVNQLTRKSRWIIREISTESKKLKKTKTTRKIKNVLVFVSYATIDADVFKIRDIAEALTKHKKIFNVLYWQEDMKDNIIKYMNDNLEKCDIMLLFCSPNALVSEPVEKEWTAADIMSKPIIPVFDNPDHIPALLKTRLGVQFDPFNFEKNLQEIYDLIMKKLE
jgi:tetratricopeptide (TPR) repeat protein